VERNPHEEAMPLTLESRARRMQVFHLPHEVFCRDRCTCVEVPTVAVAENPRTGERARKHLNKKVPGAITFLARERKPGLPSALLELAQVKAAIGRGYLRIVEQAPDVAVASSAVAAPADAAGHSPAPVDSGSSAATPPASSSSGSEPGAAASSPPGVPTASAPASAVSNPPSPPAKARGKEP
jgi:hypothetical protein